MGNIKLLVMQLVPLIGEMSDEEAMLIRNLSMMRKGFTKGLLARVEELHKKYVPSEKVVAALIRAREKAPSFKKSQVLKGPDLNEDE